MVLDGHGHDVIGRRVSSSLGSSPASASTPTPPARSGQGLAASSAPFVGRPALPRPARPGRRAASCSIRGPRSRRSTDDADPTTTRRGAPHSRRSRRGCRCRCSWCSSIAGLLHLLRRSAVDHGRRPRRIRRRAADTSAPSPRRRSPARRRCRRGRRAGAASGSSRLVARGPTRSGRMFSSVGSGSIPGIAAVRRWLGDLFRLGGHADGDASSADDPAAIARVPLFDQDARAGEPRTAKQRPDEKSRRRKPAEPTLVLPPEPSGRRPTAARDRPRHRAWTDRRGGCRR